MCCILVGVHFFVCLGWPLFGGLWETRLTRDAVPYQAQWLTGIGLAFFFLNICLFVMNCVLIALRFYWRPGSLVDSFTDQFESLFISAIVSFFSPFF